MQQPPPPPPPPPLPPPTTPHIARRASLQDHRIEEHRRTSLSQSMGDVINEIDQIKLKPVAK